MRVLVLGGTTEGRELADRLVVAGHEVETSLAGRVRRPRLPAGEVRIGGFGGTPGLVAHARGFDAVVDATHPFAATISEHAAHVDVPVLRLQRPGWPGEAGWHWVDDHAAAGRTAAGLGRRPLLTTGRRHLAALVPALAVSSALVRLVDPPDPGLPEAWTVVLDRGPYTVAGELDLLRGHGADVLVTKDSGGDATRAKLVAAARLGLPVVVVRRPPAPAGVPTVTDVDAALAWLRRRH